MLINNHNSSFLTLSMKLKLIIQLMMMVITWNPFESLSATSGATMPKPLPMRLQTPYELERK